MRGNQFAHVNTENLLRTAVGRAQPEFGIERHYARREVAEHAFQVSLGSGNLFLIALGIGLGLGKLHGHDVEGFGQQSQFIEGLYRMTLAEIALRNGTCAGGQHAQRR